VSAGPYMGPPDRRPSTFMGGLPFLSNLQGALRFDEATHTYTLGQLVLPSVTQILKATGVSTDFDRLVEEGKLTRAQLLEKRELGRAAHMAAHYYDEGSLRPGTVDPRVEPYLEGWIKFREVTGFKPAILETALHHPGLLVSGTLDRAGRFERFEGCKPFDLYVVDIKLGDPEDAAAQWQTAAYAGLLQANLEKSQGGPVDPMWLSVRPRFSVRLRDTGTYDLKRYDNQVTDWQEFCQFVTTYRRQAVRRKAAGRLAA
jgi:hypothetical protein